MTEPGARLTYRLTSTPDTLTPATAGHRRQGRLEITATRDRSSTEALRCRAVTVTVPTGQAPERLTNQPERIDTGYRATHFWHIRKNSADPRATTFTLRPQNPRHEAVFDDAASVTLILDRIPLATEPATIDVQVTADTAGPGRAFTRATTTLPLTIEPAVAD